MTTSKLNGFYGSDLVILRNNLGGGGKADTFLLGIIDYIEAFRNVPKINNSRRKLERLRTVLHRAAIVIKEEPRLSDNLIYTEGAESPDFFQPKHPFPFQELPEILEYYVSAIDWTLDKKISRIGRNEETIKFYVLNLLVRDYIKIYKKQPTYRRGSKFNELAVIILEKSGCSVSRTSASIENSLAKVVHSQIR